MEMHPPGTHVGLGTMHIEGRSVSVKSILWTTAVVLSAVLLTGLYLSFKDYRSFYLDRRGAVDRVTESEVEGDTLGYRYSVSLRSTSGLSVDCGMRVPRRRDRRCPAVVLMGGKDTGKRAVDYAPRIPDVIIIAPDYPYEPRKSYTIPTFLYDVPEIRRSLLDMVPSVMLVMDYLWQRGDIDTNRIVLVGYSFGAPFVPVLCVNDRRLAAGVMVYGGGDLRSLIAHNVRRYQSALVSECVGVLGGVLLRPLEPLRYVADMHPRPLLMINGSHDEMIPTDNVLGVFREAQEPKKLVWIASRHVHPTNRELTEQIVAVISAQLDFLGMRD
jgi:dienelactone hydrolase